MQDIKEIIAYLQEARAVGIDQATAIAELKRAGWRDDLIAQAVEDSRPKVPPRLHQHPEPDDANIIHVRNLTKRYGDFTAVDNISFEVRRGETFGILGPNGAGKTTTLEMIEGLKNISSGTVLVDGKDVEHDTHAVKSVIGVQLQASSFFEDLNLAETIDLFAALYGRTVDAMAMLGEVQLTEKAKNQVKELSGGQKQRFSIAVGLVNNPKVLFLDEPTTGLDPQARRNLWDLVTQIKKNGTTIVITTHYMDEAEILCDRIAIMDNAKIVALDTTQNLLRSVPPPPQKEIRTTATLEDVFLKLTGHQLRD